MCCCMTKCHDCRGISHSSAEVLSLPRKIAMKALICLDPNKPVRKDNDNEDWSVSPVTVDNGRGP